jgi:methionyl-tRNA formyltransferase
LSSVQSALKLGFAGTPDFAVPALERLARQYRICAVFTQPDRPAGRGQALRLSAVKRRALELGLTLHQPISFKSPETQELLRSAALDALVVVAYGMILPADVLDLPRFGCINIHASLLPRWRGAAPIQRALLAGDQITGVTIMRMDAGLDTGPMLATRSTPIGARDTAKTLHDRLGDLGAELICETLEGLTEGAVHAAAQPAEGVTYAAKINKAEALIHWSEDAASIWRQIRAFNPSPVAETRWNGRQLRIWEADQLEAPRDPGAAAGTVPGTVLGAADDGIDVACGNGILRVRRLQLAGRNPMPAQEFLKAQRLTGARFAES